MHAFNFIGAQLHGWLKNTGCVCKTSANRASLDGLDWWLHMVRVVRWKLLMRTMRWSTHNISYVITRHNATRRCDQHVKCQACEVGDDDTHVNCGMQCAPHTHDQSCFVMVVQQLPAQCMMFRHCEDASQGLIHCHISSHRWDWAIDNGLSPKRCGNPHWHPRLELRLEPP